MKIIFNYEWVDHPTESFLKSHNGPAYDVIAHTDDVECRMYYPGCGKAACESIADGKVEIKLRRESDNKKVDVADCTNEIVNIVESLKNELK